MNEQLLLVGSIPLDTPQDVFETFGAPLGRLLNAVPDGEVGPRSHWISRIHYQVFAGHPELDILAHPRPDNGVERLNPHDNSDRWQFKVRDGVERVRFGDPGWRLGYARDAINSYFVFRTLKEKGVLPHHLRFQVSMPMVNSACRRGYSRSKATSTRSSRASKPRCAPSLRRSSKRFRPKNSPSSGTARPKCRTPTARFRSCRGRA